MSRITESRRAFLRSSALSLLASQLPRGVQAAEGGKPPNFVLIFLDDSGWADFHPFGDPAYRTPNVEALARQGCSFHNFYVPQAICSASRSSLLSGCYPGRTKVFGAIAPHERGIDPKYATFGEVFRASGYRTAVFGKWHIGDQPETRPPARGFDESCGLMYSNDMWEGHPENPTFWGKYPLQFWDNGKVKVDRVTAKDQAMLTTWYTEHAVDFIRRNKSNPFLLYVPHSMPHVPIFASEKFKGKSGAGLYGDVMMEIDWSVGEIMKALKEGGVEDNTLVFFSSDNGPWISYGNHAGKTPFREAKATGFDGGIRSACILRCPGRIPAGTISKRAWSTVDMLPTMARLASAKLPANPIDGLDVWDLVSGVAEAKNPHGYYPFSTQSRFEGVISGDGRWKLHIPHSYQTLLYAGNDGKPGKYETKEIELSLFDMENDPNETRNVIAEHPDVAARLQGYAEQHRREFYPDQPATGLH
jgi:arylsulfatase A-like enzyme